MNRVIWSVPLYLLSALNPLLPANRCLGILVAMWRSDSPLLPIRANFLAWKRMNLISLISISSRKSKVSLRKSKFWHCSNLKFFFLHYLARMNKISVYRTCIFFDVFFSLSACSASRTPLWSLGVTEVSSILARLTAGLEADRPLRPPLAFFGKDKQ